MSTKLVPYKDKSLNQVLEREKDILKLNRQVIDKTKELLNDCPEKYQPLVGTFLLNMGIELCKQTYGLPQTYAIIDTIQHTMRSQLEFILEEPTEHATFH